MCDFRVSRVNKNYSHETLRANKYTLLNSYNLDYIASINVQNNHDTLDNRINSVYVRDIIMNALCTIQ